MITVCSRIDYFTPRPRMYEAELIKQPIRNIFKMIEVNFIQAEVDEINTQEQKVKIKKDNQSIILNYDVLIFGLGSKVIRPNILGIETGTFDVDTYEGAQKMRENLESVNFKYI